MLLVTTAGKVGAEATRLLAAQKQPVRVLVRDAGKGTALQSLGAEVVKGDLADTATVDRVLHGISSVILVSPAVPAQEIGVVERAVDAGVEHIIKITSKSSLDSPIPRRRDQAQIEDRLVASGLDYTLLKNNAYMQNLLLLAPQIAAHGRFGSAAANGRIGMVDTRDVAAVAAAIATAPSAHAGKTYWLTGPQTLSYGDAATIIGRVLGRPVAYASLTVDQQEQAMVDAGLPRPLAAMNARALGLFADGDSDWVTNDVEEITGRSPRDLEDFIRENAILFGSSPAAEGSVDRD